MNEREVVELMKSSTTEDEWNANTRKVKAAFDGDYPDFWYGAVIQSGVANETASKFGGSADITVTARSRKMLTDIYGRPTSMPRLEKDEQLIGIYNQGLGEKVKSCASLEDMQRLYDWYASGMALTLEWAIDSVKKSVLLVP